MAGIVIRKTLYVDVRNSPSMGEGGKSSELLARP